MLEERVFTHVYVSLVNKKSFHSYVIGRQGVGDYTSRISTPSYTIRRQSAEKYSQSNRPEFFRGKQLALIQPSASNGIQDGDNYFQRFLFLASSVVIQNYCAIPSGAILFLNKPRDFLPLYYFFYFKENKFWRLSIIKQCTVLK